MKLHIPLKSQFMYKRIKAIRRRAIFVGFFFYFIGILLLAALALLPMLKIDYLCVLPGMGMEKMLWNDMKFAWDIDTISRVLYLLTIVFVTIVIPILGARKLGWLYSKTPVRRKKHHEPKSYRTKYGKGFDAMSEAYFNDEDHYTRGDAYDARGVLHSSVQLDRPYDMEKDQRAFHGLNRNVYAMRDLGTLFSWSLTLLLVSNVLLCMLNGSYLGEKLFDFDGFKTVLVTFTDTGLFTLDIPLLAIVVGVGFVYTMFARIFGRTVRIFTPSAIAGEERKMANEKFIPIFFRTLLQFVAIIVVPIFLLQLNKVDVFVAKLLSGNFKIGTDDITAILQIVLFVMWLALTYSPIIYCRKCVASEYDWSERKVGYFYMVFVSIVTLIVSVALFVMTDNFKFDFKNVESLNAIVIVGALFLIAVLSALLTKVDVGYSEYDEVVEMVTKNDEFENVDWRYFFSDNYVGGEEYFDGDEVGSVIE